MVDSSNNYGTHETWPPLPLKRSQSEVRIRAVATSKGFVTAVDNSVMNSSKIDPNCRFVESVYSYMIIYLYYCKMLAINRTKDL